MLFVSATAIDRATMSLPPPGVNGEIKRIARTGKSSIVAVCPIPETKHKNRRRNATPLTWKL